MTTYIAPLRQGVIALGGAGRPFTAAQLAEHAGVAEDRAKAYCSTQVAGGVLRVFRNEYRQAVGWARWVAWTSRARPQKTTNEHRDRDEGIRRAICQGLRKARERSELSRSALARAAGVHKCIVFKAEKRGDVPSALALVVLTRELGLTIEDLIQQADTAREIA